MAPIALVLFALAFFAILLSSFVGGDGSAGPEKALTEKVKKAKSKNKTTNSDERETSTTATSSSGTNTDLDTDTGAEERIYSVTEGDTFETISAETGVSVEKLQEFNPDVDPQALISGQKIKLQ